jgi:DNA-binding transcriptional ArsR family regulator
MESVEKTQHRRNRHRQKRPPRNREAAGRKISRSKHSRVRIGGKLHVPAWFDDLDLSLLERSVYQHLSRRTNRFTGEAWPTERSMAKKFHRSERMIRRAIKGLKEWHLITVERRGKLNYYRLV